MPDPASQANELRLLEQKRNKIGLTEQEEARRSAAASPAGSGGFNVRVAAQEVRVQMDGKAQAPAIKEASAPLASPGKKRSLDAECAPEPALPCSVANKTIAAGSPAGDDESCRDASGTGRAEAGAQAYDAVAYGLDPSDPTTQAWLQWFREQGWDPATAYAWAQAQQTEKGTDQDAGAEGLRPEAVANEGHDAAVASAQTATSLDAFLEFSHADGSAELASQGGSEAEASQLAAEDPSAQTAPGAGTVKQFTRSEEQFVAWDSAA
ncbi:MAG TPA: hypothetical protein VMK12_11405, partial [Anaeromyxobacteraceae bacterium]|nr:hypothetical protein [Anaeromyxobacteraceae bacterium]